MYSIQRLCQSQKRSTFLYVPFFHITISQAWETWSFFCDGEEFEEGYIRSRLILRLFSTVIIDMYESLEQKTREKSYFQKD